MLLVDGLVLVGNLGYLMISGMSNVDMLRELVKDVVGIIVIGICVFFGGIFKVNLNLMGVVVVSDIIIDKLIVNILGCLLLFIVIIVVLVYYLMFKCFFDFDEL